MRLKLLVLFLSVSVLAAGQGLKVAGRMIVNERGEEVILRGIGLGGWMLQEPYMMQLSGIARTQQDIRNKISDLIGPAQTQQFYESWLSNHCTKGDIDSLAAWGFNSVRLPMHYNLFTPSIEEEANSGANTWLETGFRLTDNLLQWCKEAKIYLILDLHAAPGGQGNDIAIADRDTTKAYLWGSDANKAKTIALWEKLAARYANEEWLGAYDILNEPNFGFSNAADKNGCAETSNAELKKFYDEATAAIRAIDKRHIIIVEGNCWGNNYNGLLPFEDKNTMVSFHKYWNYNDEGSIKKFIDLRELYGMPVWCGETGENSNVWFRDAVHLFEKNKIGWAMWPLKKNGINNPLEIIAGKGYQRILDYWKGVGAKPTVEEATEALMRFSKGTHVAANRVRRDVLDAMFRQPFDSAAISFMANEVNNSTIIFATNYDLGRNGHAYWDNESANYWVSTTKRTDGNRGRQYRNDGVDISVCTDSLTNGYCVTSADEGEWLRYTIDVAMAGTYKVSVRAKVDSMQRGTLLLESNGEKGVEMLVTENKNIPTWATISANSLQLRKGKNDLRLFIKKGTFSINYIQLSRINAPGAKPKK